MKIYPQFSLRELLFAVLFLALGIASLGAGGVLASIAVFLAIVVSMCMAIIAFVGRDQLQALAIGFLIPVVVYAATVLVVGRTELDPYEGKLPTSRLMYPMFRAFVEQKWTDMRTGEVVPDYEPAKDPNRGKGFFGPPLGPIMLQEHPDRQTFMSLGHILFAMVFGYGGAKFAVVVHRRQQDAKRRSVEQSDQSERPSRAESENSS